MSIRERRSPDWASSIADLPAPGGEQVIRYAQCWEDADTLLAGLDVRPGDKCLSIASAGDNSLALLTKNPGRVVALDRNPAQLACLELRAAAYRSLCHEELLELIGSRPSARRAALYQRCRPALGPWSRGFWDSRGAIVARGIGSGGRLEQYFELFRTRILPLVHGRSRVERMLAGGTREERQAFYQRKWNTWRWRAVFRVFFSRFAMSRLGRDPAFFEFAEGGVAERFLARARDALIELDPADNPYLQWIAAGEHRTALPLALRPEHFETIRANLGCLELHCGTLEDFVAAQHDDALDRYNLSDVFEYMSAERAESLLAEIARVGRPAGRLVYWNTLVPRSRPESLAHRLRPLDEVAAALHRQERAFFYSRLVVEEIV